MFSKNIEVSKYEQGSEEWHTDKMGIQSASNAELYLVNGKNENKLGGGLISYIDELAYSFAVKSPTFENFYSKSAQWGIDTEPLARKAFSSKNMCAVEEFGFISSTEVRVGFSPDGIIKGKKEGLEIKCYDTKNHLPIVLGGVVPKKVIAQCQFSMMVSGFDSWNAVFYDPRLLEHLQYRQFKIERDNEMIQIMKTKSEICSKMIDEKLLEMGIE